MTPTLTRPRPLQRKLGGHLLVGAGVLVTALVGLVMLPGLRAPNYIDRITITNPTVYGLQVDVTDAGRDGWLVLGTAPREAATVAREVIDQGPTWSFRLGYGGRPAGEMVLSRSELKNNDWEVTIPPEVGERLAHQHMPPSAY